MGLDGVKVLALRDAERIPGPDGVHWRPLRRPLGVTAFGINAYTQEHAGERVVERHDELGSGAGGHEEIYLVVEGAATFTVGDETIEAAAGTMVFVADPSLLREARATAPDTTVLAIGGRPGVALPTAPYEHWFAAQGPSAAGDYETAAAVVSAGFADYPDHPTIHYQLACFRALDGRPDEAIVHLRQAIAGDGRAREWALDDTDLDALRDRPDFPDLG